MRWNLCYCVRGEILSNKYEHVTAKVKKYIDCLILLSKVAAGLECGLAAENWADWREGDLIECFQVVPKFRRLEDAQAATAVDLASLTSV